MKNNIIFLSVLSLLLSCGNQQDEINNLSKENKELKEKIELLSQKIDTIKVQPKPVTKKDSKTSRSGNSSNDGTVENKTSTKKYSEEEALEYIKDYYDYYHADHVYRNARARRITNNKFDISLEECINKTDFADNEFFWSSKVLVLSIKGNGKYHVEEKYF